MISYSNPKDCQTSYVATWASLKDYDNDYGQLLGGGLDLNDLNVL